MRCVLCLRRRYFIDVKFGIIMDVEASRAIRQAEVGASRTMIQRTEACFGIKPEFVQGYEPSSWFGIGAPKNTPPEIIEKLNSEINAGLSNPRMKARLPAAPLSNGDLLDEQDSEAAQLRVPSTPEGLCQR
jgi:hypothetical protein